MADSIAKLYWDSTAFVAWVKGENGRVDACDSVIRDARESKCLLYTSAISLAEVFKDSPGQEPPTAELQQRIRDFFRNDYIKLVMCDRLVGERARQLLWQFPFLHPRDAIHVASALQIQVDIVEAYDSRILRLGQMKIEGFPVFREPQWFGQAQLPLEEPAPVPRPIA